MQCKCCCKHSIFDLLVLKWGQQAAVERKTKGLSLRAQASLHLTGSNALEHSRFPRSGTKGDKELRNFRIVQFLMSFFYFIKFERRRWSRSSFNWKSANFTSSLHFPYSTVPYISQFFDPRSWSFPIRSRLITIPGSYVKFKSAVS